MNINLNIFDLFDKFLYEWICAEDTIVESRAIKNEKFFVTISQKEVTTKKFLIKFLFSYSKCGHSKY